MTIENLIKTEIMIISEKNRLTGNFNFKDYNGTYTYIGKRDDGIYWFNTKKNKQIMLSDNSFKLEDNEIERGSQLAKRTVINMYDALTNRIHTNFSAPPQSNANMSPGPGNLHNRALRISKRFPTPGGKAESDRRKQQANNNKKKRNKQDANNNLIRANKK